MKRLFKILFLAAFSMLVIGGTFWVGWNIELLENKKVLELGSEISIIPDDYFEGNDWSLSHVSVDISGVNGMEPGSYSVMLTHGWEKYEVTIEIVDTTAPVIVLREDTIYKEQGVAFPIDDLYDEVTDLSEKVSVKAADGRTAFQYQECGNYKEKIIATDASGNKAIQEVTITIDTAPHIEGLTEYYMSVNTSTDFLEGVTAWDDLDGDLTASITLLDDAVKLEKPGDYTLSYKVTDKYGLSTISETTVHVMEKDALEIKISDRELNWRFDTIIGAGNLYDAGSMLLDSVEEQMEYMQPTVVHIFYDYPEGSRTISSFGSGFIIDMDEEYVYICSNYHVLKESKRAKGTIYFFDSNSTEFEYLGGSNSGDTAIARIKKSNIPQETLEQLVHVHIDTEAFETAKEGGTPLFMQIMGKEGVRYTRIGESTYYRSGVYGLQSIPMLEASVRIVSGNSGSAIVDYEGNLIGMATGIHRGENGGYTYHNVGLEHIIEIYEDVTGNVLYKG